MSIQLTDITNIPVSTTALIHAPAANTAAAITITGVAGKTLILTRVICSYDGDPTGGNLTVKNKTAVVFNADIVASGVYEFSIVRKCTQAENLVVTLAAGGTGVSGKLNIEYILVD